MRIIRNFSSWVRFFCVNICTLKWHAGFMVRLMNKKFLHHIDNFTNLSLSQDNFFIFCKSIFISTFLHFHNIYFFFFLYIIFQGIKRNSTFSTATNEAQTVTEKKSQFIFSFIVYWFLRFRFGVSLGI